MRFDAAYNVTTQALVFLGQLDPQAVGPGIEFATHYEPTPIGDFDALMKLVPADFSFSKATFLDVGSGMGRVVMHASHYPFRHVVGVEISPALHEIARENLGHYHDARQRCRDIRLKRADVADYVFPPGNLLLYLYNPFSSCMFERFLGKLSASGPREIILIYHTPVERELIQRSSAFTLIADQGFGVIYRAKLP